MEVSLSMEFDGGAARAPLATMVLFNLPLFLFLLFHLRRELAL